MSDNDETARAEREAAAAKARAEVEKRKKEIFAKAQSAAEQKARNLVVEHFNDVFVRRKRDLLGFGGLIVAILALGYTIYQFSVTRDHNRKSVAPKLSVAYAISGDNPGVIIKNHGLGPAMISNIEVYIDGDLVDSSMTSPDNLWDEVADFLAESDPSDRYSEFGWGPDDFTQTNLSSDDPISSGGSVPVFKPTTEKLLNWFEFQKSQRNIEVRIEYRSLYDEVFYYPAGCKAVNSKIEGPSIIPKCGAAANSSLQLTPNDHK